MNNKKRFFTIFIGVIIIFSLFTTVSEAKTRVTDYGLIKKYCHSRYYGYKIKMVNFNDKRLQNRKGKKIVYVEKIISTSKGNGYGTIKGKWIIAYNKKVKKGKRVVSYCIYSPLNNYCDDVVAVIDNNKIRW